MALSLESEDHGDREDRLTSAALSAQEEAVVEPPTVEILLKTPESLARFEQLLDESDIVLDEAETPPDVRPSTKSDALETIAKVEPEAVLVEASPTQIAELVANYRADYQSFEELGFNDAGIRGVPGTSRPSQRGASRLMAESQSRPRGAGGFGGGFGGGLGGAESDIETLDSSSAPAPAIAEGTLRQRSIAGGLGEPPAEYRREGRAAGRAWQYYYGESLSRDAAALSRRGEDDAKLKKPDADAAEPATRRNAAADKADVLAEDERATLRGEASSRRRGADASSGDLVQVLFLLRQRPTPPAAKASK